MKNNEAFDRLARQKMNERHFAFDESHWAQASKAISKRGGFHYRHLLWLLLLIPAFWLSAPLFTSKSESAIAGAAHPAIVPVGTQTSSTTISGLEISASVAEVPSDAEFHSNESSATQKVVTIEKSNHITSEKTTQTMPVGESSTDKKTFETSEKRSSELSQTADSPGKLSSSSQQRHESFSPEKNNAQRLLASSDFSAISSTKTDVVSDISTSLDVTSILENNRKAIPMLLDYKTGAEQSDEKKLASINPIRMPSFSALWKWTLLAGQWNSRIEYSGEDAMPWMAQTEGSQLSGYGVELMRSFHHTGIGAGVHYTSYGETLQSENAYINRSEMLRYWYLQPVDTTVLVITDSVSNGNGYTYTGQSETRTVMVLSEGTQEVNSTFLLREARTLVNRCSYIEVPLIADIHTGRGRWMLGLRGGPTAGRLVQRRGYLPSADAGGYVALNDLTTTQWMLGYQLRAYVHYRLADNWSCGIEPGYRGLLGNTFQSTGLQRNAQAWGGFLSLSYYMRTK